MDNFLLRKKKALSVPFIMGSFVSPTYSKYSFNSSLSICMKSLLLILNSVQNAAWYAGCAHWSGVPTAWVEVGACVFFVGFGKLKYIFQLKILSTELLSQPTSSLQYSCMHLFFFSLSSCLFPLFLWLLLHLSGLEPLSKYVSSLHRKRKTCILLLFN